MGMSMSGTTDSVESIGPMVAIESTCEMPKMWSLVIGSDRM